MSVFDTVERKLNAEEATLDVLLDAINDDDDIKFLDSVCAITITKTAVENAVGPMVLPLYAWHRNYGRTKIRIQARYAHAVLRVISLIPDAYAQRCTRQRLRIVAWKEVSKLPNVLTDYICKYV